MTRAHELALAAATQAAAGTAELLEFAKCGPLGSHTNFNDEPIEKLADACKLALELEAVTGPVDTAQEQLYAALVAFLAGWAG